MLLSEITLFVKEYGWAPPTFFSRLMHLILAREVHTPNAKNNKDVVDVYLASNGLSRTQGQELPDGLVWKPWTHNLADILGWGEVGFLGFGIPLTIG